jgi:hypothetical protein
MADARRLSLFRQSVAVAVIALLGATWRLWVPQQTFPQVPLVWISWFGTDQRVIGWIQYAALASMFLAAVGMAIPNGWSNGVRPTWLRSILSRAAIGFPLGFLATVLIDQHRLQPWAVQFFALAILFDSYRRKGADSHARSAGPATDGLRLARTLVLGIYFWSALGKIDSQFAYTVGSQMVATIAGWFAIDAWTWDRDLLASVAVGLPVYEGLTAMFLFWKPARRIGVAMAVAMHGVLLAALGPWGLGHHSGVLLWNLFCCVQAILLFWPSVPGEALTASTSRLTPRRSHWLPRGLIAAMLLLPIGERFGFYDHWLSWALYAPHSSRVTLTIPQGAIGRLPESLRDTMPRNPNSDFFVTVPLDRWSLETLGVPIYPQSRFELGVAIAVVRRAGLDRDARLDVRGPSSRWSGLRETVTLNGLREMKMAGDRYLLNTRPIPVGDAGA